LQYLFLFTCPILQPVEYNNRLYRAFHTLQGSKATTDNVAQKFPATSTMSVDIAKVATVELIRELERRVRCTETKTEK
jgi:cytochrome c peroxidase